MTTLFVTGSVMSTKTLWQVRIKKKKNTKKSKNLAKISRVDRVKLLPVHQQCPWVLKGSVVLLFKGVKMTAAQQREPALWLLLFDHQPWRLPFMPLWRERLGRKIHRQSVELKKQQHMHTHRHTETHKQHQYKHRSHLLRKEMSLCRRAETHFQSTLYIQSEAGCSITLVPW